MADEPVPAQYTRDPSPTGEVGGADGTDLRDVMALDADTRGPQAPTGSGMPPPPDEGDTGRTTTGPDPTGIP